MREWRRHHDRRFLRSNYRTKIAVKNFSNENELYGDDQLCHIGNGVLLSQASGLSFEHPKLAAPLIRGVRTEIGCIIISLFGLSARTLCLPGHELPAWTDHGGDENYRWPQRSSYGMFKVLQMSEM